MTELNTFKPMRWFLFWPVLIAPVLLLCLYVACLTSQTAYKAFFWLDEKGAVDDYAPLVLLIPAALYWMRAMVTRNPLYMILTVASATLLLRELHWDPMIKVAAYPVLLGCFFWMAIWSDILAEPFRRDRKHTVLLVATLAAYLFAQVVEKRIFKFELDMDINRSSLGLEMALQQMALGFRQALCVVDDTLHSKFEEVMEMTANGLLAISALVGSWRYRDAEQRFIPLSEGFAKSPTKAFLDRLTRRGRKDATE